MEDPQGLASGMGVSSGAGSDAFAARERLERRRQVTSTLVQILTRLLVPKYKY